MRFETNIDLVNFLISAIILKHVFSGCTNTNFQIPDVIKDICRISDDCSAISCCVGFYFGDELRNMFLKFDLECGSMWKVQVERQEWSKTLVSSTGTSIQYYNGARH